MRYVAIVVTMILLVSGAAYGDAASLSYSGDRTVAAPAEWMEPPANARLFHSGQGPARGLSGEGAETEALVAGARPPSPERVLCGKLGDARGEIRRWRRAPADIGRPGTGEEDW